VNASFPLPDSGSTTPVNMSGNVGLWHFDSESSSSVPPPPTSSIGLVDSWGDGWHGSNWVSVLVNSIVVISSATLGAGAGPDWHDYPVSDGDTVDVIYSSLGSGSPHWGSECSYILNDGASGAGVNFYTSPLFPTTPYSYTASGITTYATPDSSGQGNDATINGATQVAGKVGSNAYSFDGISDYMDVGSNFAYTTEDFSFSFWVQEGASQSGFVNIFGNQSGYKGFCLETSTSSGHSYRIVTGDGSWTFGSAVALTPGAWTHFVITRSGSTISIYKNGVLAVSDSSFPTTITAATIPMWLGANQSSGRYWQGILDEFAIWERTLSDLEINNLYFLQSGSCASGSVGLGETFSFTPDVTGTYTIQLELDDSLNSMSGNVNAVISSGVTPITGTGSIEGVVWELTSETAGASVIEGNVWELSTETAGESRNEGVVWELSAEPLDKPSLNIPDIAGTVGTSSCFYATASYTTTGSILYSWEWTSIPSGSLITSGSRTGFSGSGGAYSEVPTGSIACYLPDITGSYIVKGTFYSDTGSGGGSFAFDTATGVESGPATPIPCIESGGANPQLILGRGLVINNYLNLSAGRERRAGQVPFKLGIKDRLGLRNSDFISTPSGSIPTYCTGSP